MTNEKIEPNKNETPLNQDYYNYIKQFYDIQKTLREAGVDKNSLRGDLKVESSFSKETNELYDQLKIIVQDEWEVFKNELTEEIKNNKNNEQDGQRLKQLEAYKDEAGAFNDLDIKNSGLLSSDAVKCFEDEERTKIFFETINKKIEQGDDVLEAGAGTGIMAIAAACKGAGKVTALEINPVTAAFAKRVVARCEEAGVVGKGVIEIIENDALKFDPGKGKKFDAFISENIYTGQFHELQMQINNHLNQYVDIGQDKIIPRGMINGVELVSLSDEVKGKTGESRSFVVNDFVNREADGQAKEIGSVSDPEVYDYINLKDKEPIGVMNRIVKTAAKDGKIDGITVFSLIQMSDDKGDFIRRNQTKFLNDDIVVNLEKSLIVNAGDEIEIYISYKAGENPEQADIRLRNINTGEETTNKKNKERFDSRGYIDAYYEEKIDSEKCKWVLDELRKEKTENKGKVNIQKIAEKTNFAHEKIENLMILDFQKNVSSDLLEAYPEDNIKILDVGGGPTIYQHIANSLVAGEGSIIHSEYLKQNREEVQKWIDDDGGYNWDEYFMFMKKLFQDDTEFLNKLEVLSKSDSEAVRKNISKIQEILSGEKSNIEDYKKHLRKTVAEIVPVDVFKPGMGLDKKEDGFEMVSAGRESVQLLSSNFVIESATGKESEWITGMKNVMEQVKKGGFLSMTAIRNASWYQDGVGQETMAATRVNEDDIKDILVENGFVIKRLEVLQGSDKEKVGYDGMVFVFAQKL